VTYSIFAGTMADMTYQQVEEAAAQQLPVLFPIAVIEEHGPHLPLATDTYIAHQMCMSAKRGLAVLGQPSVVAPPLYWGINRATSGFAGSFTVRPQTMIDVLLDALACLNAWGFAHVFVLNFHGDPAHNTAIVATVKRAYEEWGIGVFFPVPPWLGREGLGLTGDEPYLLVEPPSPQPRPTPPPPPAFLDIHAGGWETRLMLNYVPDLVDAPLARSLESSRTPPEVLGDWQQGGAAGRALTPLGYVGDPSENDSEINLEIAERHDAWTLRILPRLLMDCLTRP